MDFTRIARGLLVQRAKDDVRHGELACEGLVGASDDDAVAAGIERQDIVRFAGAADSKALALSDRVVPEAMVVAEDAPRAIDDIPFPVLGADEFGDIAGIKILGVGLVGHGDAEGARLRADLLLANCAKGKDLPRKLLLGKAVEEVALVAGVVDGALDGESAVIAAPDAGVVASGEAVELKAGAHGEIGEKAKLHQGVAADAGVGGSAGEVGFAEVADNCRVVFGGAVEDAVFDADFGGEGGGGFDVVLLAGAEAGVARAATVAAIPKPHRDAHDVMSLLFQQDCGHA